MGRIIFVEAGDSAYTPLKERVTPKNTVPPNIGLLLGGILVAAGILRFYYDRVK